MIQPGNDSSTPKDQQAAALPYTDPMTSNRPARTLALMNQKGGVGKTTTAVNLAAGLARQGRSTLLIDLDPQAHASLHLGIEVADEGEQQRPTIYDLLMDPSLDPMQTVRTRSEKLDVIPAETDLAAAESELASAHDRTDRLRAALARFGNRYDHVLIDCPPSLGLLTLNALACADQVLIPMQAHFLALHGVGKLLETVKLLSQSVNPDLRVLGVVLCAFDAQSSHTREVVADLEQFFASSRESGEPWNRAGVLEPAVRRNIKLAECPSFGQTIFEYAPGVAGAEDYEALARSVVERLEQPTDAPVPEIHVVSSADHMAEARQ